MSTSLQILGRYKLRILFIILVAASVYGFVPQLAHSNGSWSVLLHAQRTTLLLATVAGLSTYVSATLVYMTLAFKTLPFWRTLVVQFAAMFVNRLLPAGIGAMGVNGAYLHRQKHSTAGAAT